MKQAITNLLYCLGGAMFVVGYILGNQVLMAITFIAIGVNLSNCFLDAIEKGDSAANTDAHNK